MHSTPISSTFRVKEGAQQQQINVLDQNSIMRALKNELSLELQPTKVGQKLCAKPKQGNYLLKYDFQIEFRVS